MTTRTGDVSGTLTPAPRRLFCQAISAWVKSVALGQAHGRALAATGSLDGTARIWNLATGVEEAALIGHDGPIWTVSLAGLDGDPVAFTGGADRTVRIWDLRCGDEVDRIELPRPVFALASGPGSELVVAYGPELAVFDPPAQLWRNR